MNLFEVGISALVGYFILDFILSLIYGRCMLPGLKCSNCKEKR